MDKKELRQFLGQPHFAPEMNPPAPKHHWFHHNQTPKVTIPKSTPVDMVKRQDSNTDETGSPVGSPVLSASPGFHSPPPFFHEAMKDKHVIKTDKAFFHEFDFSK